MKTMSKTRQFYLILLATRRIGGIGKLHQIFLGTLVLRKFRHPEEGLRERIQKVSNTMETRYSHRKKEKNDDEKKRLENDDEQQMRLVCMKALNQNEEEYGKTNYIKNGVNKSLENLQDALEHAEIPDDCVLDGENVSCVLKYLEEESKIFLKVGKIEPLNDEEITFLVSLYKERRDHESKSWGHKDLEELAESIMKKNGEFNKLSEMPGSPEEKRKKAVRRKIRDLEDALSSTDIQDISGGISDDNLVIGVLDYVKSELSEN